MRVAIFSLAILTAVAAHTATAAVEMTSADRENPTIRAAVKPSQKPAAEQPATPVAPEGPGKSAAPYDYGINPKSEVFGAELFTGAFSRQGGAQFNADYAIAVGDRIQLRLWGAFEHESVLTVDAQGSVFVPHVGPIRVLGVRNQELQRVVEGAVRKVFRANVFTYVSLAAAQPVRVFVGGAVSRPGLYGGTSMDSLLAYLDHAGGIDLDRGSFLNVQVKRGDVVRATVNLYDFLLQGQLPVIQLGDGDVIFVSPRQNYVRVAGLAANAKTFEFASANVSLADVTRLAKPSAVATHVRVVRNSGTIRNIEYYRLEEAAAIALSTGDAVEFTADKKPGTITVRVEGEHSSSQEYVLPYGSRVGAVLQQLHMTERSDAGSIQLIRQSVKDRQKKMLATALKSLESSVLTARSGTSEEANLRKEEADLILKWVDRAKALELSGQVLISQTSERDDLLLENGDVLRVPTRDGLVLISGEVLFPNAVAFDKGLDLGGYIRSAGGYSQNADSARIVLAHRDGSFEEATERTAVRTGDEILVLPKIDVKSRQIFKEMVQVIYQIAISARVVLTGF